MAYTPDMLTAEIDANSGAYACVARYVLSTTAQSSGVVPLGVVVVAL